MSIVLLLPSVYTWPLRYLFPTENPKIVPKLTKFYPDTDIISNKGDGTFLLNIDENRQRPQAVLQGVRKVLHDIFYFLTLIWLLQVKLSSVLSQMRGTEGAKHSGSVVKSPNGKVALELLGSGALVLTYQKKILWWNRKGDVGREDHEAQKNSEFDAVQRSYFLRVVIDVA